MIDYRNVLFFGNSITKHPPAPEIGWGNSGDTILNYPQETPSRPISIPFFPENHRRPIEEHRSLLCSSIGLLRLF